MTLAIWPADLPQRVLRQDYSEALADGRTSTKMEAAPNKRRARFAGVQQVSCSIDGQGHVKGLFRQFWTETTLRGTAPFLIPDQTEHGFPICGTDTDPLLVDADTPLLVSAWWLAQFGDAAPTITNWGGTRYKITFALEVLP